MMDNTQGTAQADPQGQSAPVEQVPSVQSNEPAPTGQTVEATTESPKPSNETSFEALMAKKGFKSPDDFAKSYQNLEGLSTRTAQRAAELEKEFFPQAKAQEVVQPQQIRPQDEEKALLELKQFIQKETEPLKQEYEMKLKTEIAKIELNQVVKEHPDFANYTSDIKQLKSKYPDMPFSEAYTFAKAMKGDLINEAKAEGLREGTKAAYKQVAASVAPQKAAAEDRTVSPKDLLSNASKRWTVRPGMKQEEIQRIRAEQEYIERQLQANASNDRDFLSFSNPNR